MTKKQWAFERNFSVFRLKGVEATLKCMINSEVLTHVEKHEAQAALGYIRVLTTGWKSNNIISKSSCI